jgi:hypothetical protein
MLRWLVSRALTLTTRQPERRAVHRALYALLAGGLAFAAVAGGCAQTGQAVFGGSDAGGSFQPQGDGGIVVNFNGDGSTSSFNPTPTGTCSDGVVSVTVAPAMVNTTVTYGADAGASMKQMFTAQGTWEDGATADITSCAGWTTSAPDLSTVMGGAFSTTTAGQYTVTAISGTAQGSATITVKVTGSANPGNIDTTKLDGTPSGTAPQIAYPLDGSLFPLHFGDLAFQMVPSSAGQTIARIAFEGDAIDLKVYAPCTPIPNATIAGACSITLPPDIEDSLAGASNGVNMKETVRLAAADGSKLAESASIDVRWAPAPLPGSIYYWSKPSKDNGSSAASEIVRMNLQEGGSQPEEFYTWLDAVPYADTLSGGWACIGCHAISQDGKKMAITLNGASVGNDGQGSLFALVDVATRSPISARIIDSNNQLLKTGFATFTTFSPDDMSVVQSLQGALYLRTADVNLTSTQILTTMTEKLTHPYWSQKGDLLAFASWVPTTSIPHAYDSADLNGNETPNSQIWVSQVTGTTFGTPKLIVPRVSTASEFYPTISDDSAYVLFNESSCSGPATASGDGYGGSPCDGYDDPSARLRLVAAGGGTPLELDRASGRTSGWPTTGTWTNSWPRFSPAHTTFQGKTLYWAAFSSRRPYGAVLPGSQDGTSVPQIWFAGIAVDPNGNTTGDPSFAPVWLPQQNNPTPEVLFDGGTGPSLHDGGPTGNHVPQWVYTYVPYVPPMMPPPPPPPPPR